ncbi:MAG: hypothetical protein QXP38_11665 [Nitrososphaerota archaeon]
MPSQDGPRDFETFSPFMAEKLAVEDADEFNQVVEAFALGFAFNDDLLKIFMLANSGLTKRET